MARVQKSRVHVLAVSSAFELVSYRGRGVADTTMLGPALGELARSIFRRGPDVSETQEPFVYCLRGR